MTASGELEEPGSNARISCAGVIPTCRFPWPVFPSDRESSSAKPADAKPAFMASPSVFLGGRRISSVAGAVRQAAGVYPKHPLMSLGLWHRLNRLVAGLKEPKQLLRIEAQDHFFGGALDVFEEEIAFRRSASLAPLLRRGSRSSRSMRRVAADQVGHFAEQTRNVLGLISTELRLLWGGWAGNSDRW